MLVKVLKKRIKCHVKVYLKDEIIDLEITHAKKWIEAGYVVEHTEELKPKTKAGAKK
jgi:hypothetical protein